MSTARRIRRGVAVWQQTVSRQRESGVSVREFCRRERINSTLFYCWRRKLKGSKRDRQPQIGAREARALAPFIDLGSIGAGAGRCEVRLDFGGGVVLTLARG
jgi:putative transposase